MAQHPAGLWEFILSLGADTVLTCLERRKIKGGWEEQERNILSSAPRWGNRGEQLHGGTRGGQESDPLGQPHGWRMGLFPV